MSDPETWNRPMLAEKAATNVSRRQLLGQFGRGR
jgi:hypothetical protein